MEPELVKVDVALAQIAAVAVAERSTSPTATVPVSSRLA